MDKEIRYVIIKFKIIYYYIIIMTFDYSIFHIYYIKSRLILCVCKNKKIIFLEINLNLCKIYV